MAGPPWDSASCPGRGRRGRRGGQETGAGDRGGASGEVAARPRTSPWTFPSDRLGIAEVRRRVVGDGSDSGPRAFVLVVVALALEALALEAMRSVRP